MSLKRNKRRKQAIKNKRRKQAKKTIENIEKVKKYLEKHGESKTSDIAAYIGLSPARTRVILSEMDNVISLGGNSDRRDRLRWIK